MDLPVSDKRKKENDFNQYRYRTRRTVTDCWNENEESECL